MPETALRRIRVAMLIGQGLFSELLGISPCYLSMIEKGANKPGIKVMNRVSVLLGVSLEEAQKIVLNELPEKRLNELLATILEKRAHELRSQAGSKLKADPVVGAASARAAGKAAGPRKKDRSHPRVAVEG